MTADVQADDERMKARGAAFTMPPTNVTAPKIAMRNDTCGNVIQVTQALRPTMAHAGHRVVDLVTPKMGGHGELPRSVSLKLVRPAALSHLSHSEFVAQLLDLIGDIEKRASAERAQSRTPVIGRHALGRQNWQHSPRSREPRRQLNPRVACKNTWRRIEALLRNRAWLAAYRKAREEFVAGIATCFPAGTFWLRRFAGVPCEPFLTG